MWKGKNRRENVEGKEQERECGRERIGERMWKGKMWRENEEAKEQERVGGRKEQETRVEEEGVSPYFFGLVTVEGGRCLSSSQQRVSDGF